MAMDPEQQRRQAIINQMDAPPLRAGDGQMFAPGEPPPGSAGQQPQTQDYQSIFMNAAQGKRPTQASYAELDKALGGQGFNFQRDSAGLYRGRIQDPSGFVFDTNLNESDDAAFMGGREGTGQFGMLKRFHKNEVPGGWSGGGGGPMPMLQGPSLPAEGLLESDQAQKIRAELDALINGQDSPMRRNALLGLMG